MKKYMFLDVRGKSRYVFEFYLFNVINYYYIYTQNPKVDEFDSSVANLERIKHVKLKKLQQSECVLNI